MGFSKMRAVGPALLSTSWVPLLASLLLPGCGTVPSDGGTLDAGRSSADHRDASVVLRSTRGVRAPAPGLSGSTLDESSARWRVTLPRVAGAPLRLVSGDDAESWIEVQSPGRAPATVPQDGFLVAHDVAPSTDRAHFAEPGRVEELLVLHDAAAPRRFDWSIRTGGDVGSIERVGDRLLVRDRHRVARFGVSPVVAIDADGRRRSLTIALDSADASRRGGFALSATLDVAGLRYPIVIDPVWTALTPTIPNDRYRADAWLYGTSGEVLYAGGESSTPGGGAGTPNAAVVRGIVDHYDPVAAAWSSGASLGTNVVGQTHGALTGNQVIITSADTGATHVYDVDTDTWLVGTASAPIGSLETLRDEAGIVTLPSGQVLIFGGAVNGITPVSSAEIWDPVGHAWSPAGTMPRGVWLPMSTVLPSGNVLVVGGDAGGASVTDAQIYYAATNSWAATGPMNTARVYGTVLPLPASTAGADRAIVVGGSYQSTPSLAAEVWSSDGGVWTPTATGPDDAPYVSAASLLANGTVLRAAGEISASNPANEFTDAILYDPVANTWTPGGTVGDPRVGHSQLLMPNGQTWLIGGNTTAVVDVFSTQPNGAPCSGDSICTSGFCTDSVCCDTACAGACTYCNLPKLAGTCSAVSGAPDPHGVCPAEGTANPCASGLCEAGACGVKAAATACGSAASCTGNSIVPAASCNGTSSTCPIPVAGDCPGSLNCNAAGTGCLTSCASDTDCAVGACSGGACVVPSDAGADATSDATGDATGDATSDATSDVEDGDAIDAAIDTSADVVDAGSPETGGDSTLSDTGAESAVDVGVDTALVDVGADAVADTAPDALLDAPIDVAPADVGGDAPATDTAVDVVSVNSDAATPAPVQPYQACASDTDCPTQHCSHGVCCDSACTGTCMTCSLATSPGTCVAAPLGLDPLGQCGNPSNCISTCDGAGGCTAAFKGTQCAPSTCTDASHGTGPSYCSAAEKICDTSASTPFDCAPYACAPSFGACYGFCTSADDCASGFVCDSTSQKCVAAPPSSKGGCSVTAGRASGEGGAPVVLFAGAIAGALASRRRRASPRASRAVNPRAVSRCVDPSPPRRPHHPGAPLPR